MATKFKISSFQFLLARLCLTLRVGQRSMSVCHSAFTLVELIIVMVIVGILATVVIIKFTGVESQSTRIAASELRSHLTYIRNMAMSQERAMRVQFVSNSYDVYMADTIAATNWTQARDPVTQKDWIVDLGSKFSGVTLGSVNINGGNTLYFSETNGIPFDSGPAPLVNNGVINFKNSEIRIRIMPVTGYVDLMEKEITAEPIESEPIEPEPLP